MTVTNTSGRPTTVAVSFIIWFVVVVVNIMFVDGANPYFRRR